MIRFIVYSLLTTTLGFAQLNDNDRQELLQKNILANPGFESGKQRWTASAGTFTAVTSGVGTGKGAVTWDSSATSQTLTSTAVSIPSGLYGKNGVVSCAIKTTSGSATHTIQAYDGTNIVASGTIGSSTSSFQRTSVNFVLPSSGSLSLRLVSVASNEPEITVDDCFLGLAEGFNVGEVSQAVLVGTLKYAGTANCAWSGTSTTFANFSADTDCPTASVTGSATAPGTKIPAVTFSNLSPGNYQVVVQSRLLSDTASGACAYQVSDGTTASGTSIAFSGAGSSAAGTGLVGSFPYTTTQSSVTFQVQYSRNGGTNCLLVNDNANGGNFEIFVYKFPTSTEQAYRPEIRDLGGTLTYAGTTNCAWDTNSGTFANFSADTDCPAASVSGIVSAPGTKIPGISLTNLPAGKYLVLAQGRSGSASGGATLCNYRLSDGTNTSGSSATFLSVTGDVNANLALAGVFTYTSLQSSLTIQVQGAEVLATGGTCRINNDQTPDGLQFQIIPLSPAIQTPLLVGSVTSSSTGAERIERASFTCSGSSSLSNNSPGITAIGTRSTAGCAITLSGFSSTPVCVVARNQTGTATEYAGLQVTSSTSTTVYNSSASDWAGHIVCIGPR